LNETQKVAESQAASLFEAYRRQPGVTLPGGDCHAAALDFVTFCQAAGANAHHVFVEFDRGRNVVEHYMAWFPDEQVVYDLAPQNVMSPDFVALLARRSLTGPAEGATHVVYTPQDLLRRQWRIGMNGLGWTSLDPGAIQV